MKSLPAVKYQMKHSKFVGICMNVLDCMREDIAILEQHSITEEKIHEVEILFNQFKVLTSDYVQHNNKIGFTKDVAAARKEVVAAIAKVRVHVKIAFGQDHEYYKEFQFDNIRRAGRNELPQRAKNVADTAAKYAAELSESGLQAADITRLQEKIAGYTAALHQVGGSVTARTEAVRERRLLGNEIYTKLAGMCKVAQLALQQAGSHRYKYYMIYAEKSGKKSKAKTRPADTAE